MKIGFAGLGPLGSAMAGHLLKAGHALTVWNRTPEKAEPLLAQGARRADSPAALAAEASVVITSLAHDEAVEQVVFGDKGLLESLAAGATHIATSTLSPALSARLAQAHAQKGQHYVAAPVLGRPPAAAQGKLFVMAAGAPEAVASVRPVLEGLGQRLFLLGERPERAHLLKLACNFLIMSTIEQLGEVFALTEKGGLDRAQVFEVLTGSFFTAPVHKNYGQLIVDRAFDPPGATVKLGAKDTRMLLEAADALAVPLPFASVVRERFVASRAQGEEGLDFAVLARHAARDAGLGD